MKDQRIELPPLPYLELGGLQPDSHASRAIELWARAAVEADRQRRGEPVAWMKVVNRNTAEPVFTLADPKGIFKSSYRSLGYLDSPQPAEPDNDQRQNSRQIIHETIHAEPVVVDHGETRMDADVPAKYGSVSGKVVDHGSEPVRVPSAADILHLWDSFVGDPNDKYPLADADKLAFARALLARYGTQPAAPGWTTINDVIAKRFPDDPANAARAQAAIAEVLAAQPAASAEPSGFRASVRLLCVAARTSGGTSGRDEGLCAALDRVEAMLSAMGDPDWQAQASQRPTALVAAQGNARSNWKCNGCGNGSGWHTSYTTGYPHDVPCRYCNPNGAPKHTISQLESDPFLAASAWRTKDAPVAAQPSVPDGWKLVPVEPTPEMIDAGHADYERSMIGNRKDVAAAFLRRWKAMLAAAPTPPADGQAQQATAAVCFVHELAMGAYKPEEIEARSKQIARMAPLDAARAQQGGQ